LGVYADILWFEDGGAEEHYFVGDYRVDYDDYICVRAQSEVRVMNKVALLVFGVVLLASSVFALNSTNTTTNATVSGIAVLNCGVFPEDFTNNMSCGSDYKFSCDVSTTAIRINNVTFEISHGDDYFIQGAGPYYGTTKNATWALAMTADGTPYVLEKVDVVDSTLKHCGSNDDLRDIGCMVNFTSHRTIGGACAPDVCYWSNVTACRPDDRLVTVFAPTAACNAQNYTQEGVCDYCTPSWVLGNSFCAADFNSSDPFSGNMTAGYYDENDCYAQTGLASDAQKPGNDISGISCVLDYELADGKTPFASYNVSSIGGFSQSSTVWQTAPQEVGGNSWLARKPLAFDIDGDGRTNIFTFPYGQSRIRSAEQIGAALTSNSYMVSLNGSALGEFRGQAAMFGVGLGTVGTRRGVAGIVDGSNGRQYFYARDLITTNGSIVEVDLTNSSLFAVGGGVACYGSKCYFISQTNDVVSIDWFSGAVDSIDVSNVTTGVLEKQMQVPVFVSTNATYVADRVVVVGTSGSGPAVFNCDLALNSCSSHAIGGNVSIDDVSKLAVVVKNGESFVEYTTSVLA
jgi:hypothetical protein